MRRLIAFFWDRGIVTVPSAIEEDVVTYENGTRWARRGSMLVRLPDDARVRWAAYASPPSLEYINGRTIVLNANPIRY